MDRVPNMGMRRDLSQRVSLVRVDDVHRRSRLEAAHEAIYEHNNTVDGAAIERLLKDNSLLPTTVSVPFFDMRPMLMFTCSRMRFLRNCHHSSSICSPCLW
jgi:hypothetical protein